MCWRAISRAAGSSASRSPPACCIEPRLLLLDEPTAGVDVKARREFWDLIHDMAGEGLTVLVSTHYMDEAERCKRIVYLATGRIVVQGDARDVTIHSGLITFEATGADIDAAARRLRRLPGVEAAAVFGRALHVAGTDRAALTQAIGSIDGGLSWREVEPRLEDVFIHMLNGRRENRRDRLLPQSFHRALAQGMDAGAPRSDHLALHHRFADHAALPVRLCDQRRSQTSADRYPFRRRIEI